MQYSRINYTLKFDDNEHKKLAHYVDLVSKKGVRVVLSNSDPKNTNSDDNLVDDIYSQHKISRVTATKIISTKEYFRGEIIEYSA